MSPAADSRKHTYKVRIFNQTYSIASSASEAEFQQIADHVDHLMHTIASRSGSADSTRAAVMAAMHLADKLRQSEHRLQELATEQHQALAHVEEQTGYLERLLRETLEMDDLPLPVSVADDGFRDELAPASRAALAAGRAESVPAPLRLPLPDEDFAEAESTTSDDPSPRQPAPEEAARSVTGKRARARRELDASMPTLFPMEDPAE